MGDPEPSRSQVLGGGVTWSAGQTLVATQLGWPRLLLLPGCRKCKRSPGPSAVAPDNSQTEEDEEEGDEQRWLLNTPQRKKWKSTSKYIYQTLFLNAENSDIKICEQNKLIDKVETNS